MCAVEETRLTVRDPQGREWHVKQPPHTEQSAEGPVEIVLSRVLSAVGCHQPPVAPGRRPRRARRPGPIQLSRWHQELFRQIAPLDLAFATGLLGQLTDRQSRMPFAPADIRREKRIASSQRCTGGSTRRAERRPSGACHIVVVR
jgi:hypothetical protein